MALIIHRIFRTRLKLFTIPFLYLALLFGLAAMRSVLPPHRSAPIILTEWGTRFIPEMQILLSGVWREPMTVAAMVLALGTVLHLVPLRFRAVVVRCGQLAMVLLGIGISIDLVYLFATGQLLSAPVVSFATGHIHDFLPLILAEVTGARVALVIAGLALPALWAWRYKHLGRSVRPMQMPPFAGLSLALAGVLGLALPVMPANSMPFDRFSESSLIAFGTTALTSPSLEAERNVVRDFERDGRPKWYSAGMKLVATDNTVKKNVVIVMMESVRASSTTMYDPQLPTMPYLKHLSDKAMLVQVTLPRFHIQQKVC